MKITPVARINGLMGEVVRYADNGGFAVVLTLPHSKSRKECVHVIPILEYEARELEGKWNVTIQNRPALFPK